MLDPFGHLGAPLWHLGAHLGLGVLESSVTPSISFEALKGSLDLSILAPARALGRPLLRLFGPR